MIFSVGDIISSAADIATSPSTRAPQVRIGAARRLEWKPIRDASLGNPIGAPQRHPGGAMKRQRSAIDSVRHHIRQLVRVQPAAPGPCEFGGHRLVSPPSYFFDVEQWVPASDS